MWVVPTLRVQVAIAVVIAALTLPACLDARADRLERHVRGAKAKGLTSLTLGQSINYAYLRSLDDLLNSYSALIITPRRINVDQDRSGLTIETWHTFDVIEVLSSRPADKEHCQEIRRGFRTQGSEVALKIDGGSVTFEDVLVTLPSSWPAGPRLNERYLAIVAECGDRTVVLPFGTADIFWIESTGAISAVSAVPAGTAEEALLREGGSLKTLRARLEALTPR